MSTVVLLAVFFVLFNSSLKLSFWKPWQLVFAGVFLAIFVWIIYPAAISHSQVDIHAQLQNSDIRQRFVVLLTIETFIYMAFCFTHLVHVFQPEKKKSFVQFLLNIFPGLLALPVIFFLFMLVVFHFSGIDFSLLAVCFGLFTGIVIPLFARGLRALFPEEDFRIEMLFISGFLVVVLGLISTYQGNMVYKIEQKTDFINTGSGIGMIVIFAIFGFFFNRIYWQLKNKKEK